MSRMIDADKLEQKMGMLWGKKKYLMMFGICSAKL